MVKYKSVKYLPAMTIVSETESTSAPASAGNNNAENDSVQTDPLAKSYFRKAPKHSVAEPWISDLITKVELLADEIRYLKEDLCMTLENRFRLLMNRERNDIGLNSDLDLIASFDDQVWNDDCPL